MAPNLHSDPGNPIRPSQGAREKAPRGRPEEIQPEQPHPAEELEPIALEAPKPEEEREAEAGQEEPKPAREKPGEAEKPEPEEPESLAPENLEKLSEEISRLKDLLELSQELRKEVEKLAKTLTTPKKPGKS